MTLSKDNDCECGCHKPKPFGWDSETCCPDCGSSLTDDVKD